jgi:hypothetical protein
MNQIKTARVVEPEVSIIGSRINICKILNLRPTFLKFIITSIVLSSCATIYNPNSRNLPMFSGKGEFQASASAGSGLNVQTAFAVSNHLGVMANGMHFSENAATYQSNHLFGEFGVGYFINHKNLYFDLFGGGGIGQVDARNQVSYTNGSVDHIDAKGDFSKFFIQPCVALKFKNFQIGLAARFARLDFSNLIDPATGESKGFPSVGFFEPCLVYRYFIGRFSLSFHGGFSKPLSSANGVIFKPIQDSFGVGVRLGGKKKSSVLKAQ